MILALRDYMITVGKNLRCILENLTLEQIIGKKGRNKGFRHIGRDRKPFSFIWKLWGSQKSRLAFDPPKGKI